MIAFRSGNELPTLDDIAVALCRTPMFAGQTQLWYSVAHHCVACAKIAENSGESKALALLCLMHEAEVCAFGDVPGPMKTKEHRGAELEFRQKLFAKYRVWDGLWQTMEFYDKLEQAASIEFLILEEKIHRAVWDAAPVMQKNLAILVSKTLYREYPPADCVSKYPRLADLFVNKFSELS